MDICSLDTKPLLTITDAAARIKAAIQPIAEAETVSLEHALARVLAEPVIAPISLPYERNAAMDGYALAGTAIQNQAFSLQLAGTSWAGQPFAGKLEPGQCVRIFTGAVVPEAADTVIMQEQVQADGEIIHFPGNLKKGQNVREVGEDIRQGQQLCPRGKKLAATDLGLLAAAGVASVTVTRRIKIAFFSTGDELLPLGETLVPGKIYDSNSHLLAALLDGNGYEVTNSGILADDPESMEKILLATANNYDVIITSGGASVGDADYIKTILARCGHVDFWKIAIKPGKPLAFGTIGTSYFFGLPGNPAAVLTTFQQLVAPALRQLAGAPAKQPLRLKAICTSDLKKSPGRQEFQRGLLAQNEDGEFLVSTAGKQGSHILSTLADANCAIVLAADCAGVAAGELVMVEPYDVWL